MHITIPAPLHSYHELRSTGYAAKGWNKKKAWARTNEYKQSQRNVRMLANLARIPDTIGKKEYAVIRVEIYWKSLARMDGANVYKWLEDALFEQDRRVFDFRVTMHEHQSEERADIKVDIFPSTS